MGEDTYQVRVFLLGTFEGQREKKGRALEWLTNPDIWIAFITLTALEVVLGIFDIISILADKLPQNQLALARRVGLELVTLLSPRDRVAS